MLITVQTKSWRYLVPVLSYEFLCEYFRLLKNSKSRLPRSGKWNVKVNLHPLGLIQKHVGEFDLVTKSNHDNYKFKI